MAEAMGLMSGAAPYMRKFQVEETFANPGVMGLVAADGTAGLDLPIVGTADEAAGLTLDTATYTTAQGTGENSAERQVTVILNTDLIWKWRLSGSSTEGTALTQHTVTADNSGGVTITTGTEWSSPQFDEGVVWFYSGANEGQLRKLTGSSSSAGTVLIPFDNGIVTGDVALRAPYHPFDVNAIMQLTDAFFEADASIAVATGQAEWYPLGFDAKTINSDGTTQSYVHMIFGNYFINQLS